MSKNWLITEDRHHFIKKDGDITKATMDASLSSSEVVDNISKMSIEKGESSRARNKKRR